MIVRIQDGGSLIFARWFDRILQNNPTTGQSLSPVGFLVRYSPLLVGVVGVAGREAERPGVRLQREAVAVQAVHQVVVDVVEPEETGLLTI